jgi:hypothetical protein
MCEDENSWRAGKGGYVEKYEGGEGEGEEEG